MPLKYFVKKMKEVLKSTSELAFGEIPLTGAVLSYKEFDTNGLATLGFHPAITFEQGILLTKDWMVNAEHDFKF